MSLITLGNKKWSYYVTSHQNKKGSFKLSQSEKFELKKNLSLEINDLKSDQIVKDYEDKDSYGEFYKNNGASRKFEQTEIYKRLQMDVTDIAMNIESAEFLKVDLDKDTLTKSDIKDVYIDAKKPNENSKLCYIFRMHYFDAENDKDIPVYIKFNFDIYKDRNNNFKEQLVIKSFHLDDQSFPDKISYDKDLAKSAPMPEERNYDYVNEWEFEEKHNIPSEEVKRI